MVCPCLSARRSFGGSLAEIDIGVAVSILRTSDDVKPAFVEDYPIPVRGPPAKLQGHDCKLADSEAGRQFGAQARRIRRHTDQRQGLRRRPGPSRAAMPSFLAHVAHWGLLHEIVGGNLLEARSFTFESGRSRAHERERFRHSMCRG